MALRRAGLLALPLALAACTSVTQEPPPPDLVFVSFASPNIPTPNDLALASLVTRLPQVNACQTPFDLCAAPPNAQVELLCTFRAAGGFPSDLETPISIPISAKHFDPASGPFGAYAAVAAPLVDVATVTDQTVSVVRIDVSPPVAYKMGSGPTDPTAELKAEVTAGTCAGAVCQPGVLKLRLRASPGASTFKAWPAKARIAYSIRGGASGVKAVGGVALAADSAIALTVPNKDLDNVQNQPTGGVPDTTPAGGCGAGSNADEVQLLETVRGINYAALRWCYMAPSTATGAGGWNPVTSAQLAPFCTAPAIADVPAANAAAFTLPGAFPTAEIVAAGAFGTAPSAGPLVVIDAGAGVAPLPIDLLRTDADGTIAFSTAFGAAAGGIDTLDGFSTTGMMLAQTSAPVDASTVNGANVFLFELNGAGAPTLVRELKAELGRAQAGDPTANPAAAGYVAQPTPIVVAQGPACPVAGGCSPAIGLQPAVTAPTPAGTFFLPPLKGGKSYAVVVTSRVKGIVAPAGTLASLARPTVGKMLLEFTRPLAAGGKSLVPGVPDATAVALQTMRDELQPVFAALPAGTTKADVATAYTFRTQTTVGTSLALSAAPYGIEAAAGAVFTSVAAPTAVTPPGGVPTTNVGGFFTIPFNSVDGIDKSTGAFRPTLAGDLADPVVLQTLIAPLTAFVAIPNPASGTVPLCPGAPATGPFCPKLVVFGHGLNGAKENLFATASSLASAGFVAAAIDFPLHGSRNWCGADTDCVVPGTGADGTCDKAGAFAGSAGQGDAVRPGVCSAGSVPKAAGARYFVSANFFRTRDAFRQNVLDASALVLALARPPSPLAPQPAQNPFAQALLAAGLVVDPSEVYYEGISLGSIGGTSVLATSPRLTRASLSVGGGTVVDVFTNSPTFQPQSDALFATLIPGFSRAAITPGDPAFNPAVAADYLKTLNVAKWILDPGDPINYALHLRQAPLPNLLADPTGATPQAPKEVFAQVANGDTVVPNPFNLLLDNLIGAHITTYLDDDPANGPAPHSMLATTPQVQADAALFLVDPTNPANYPATRALPFP